MKYRKFGNTDLEVSEVGFGAWALGGNAMIGETAIGWGPADDETSVKAIHAALDAGINFFDTADIYGLGHSEDLLGKTLAGRPDVIIATKVGNVARDEKFTVDYDAAYIIEACEKSLQRLRRDTIDYYQLHTARLSHLQEDVDVIGISILSGAHMTVFPNVLKLMKEKGLDDVLLTGGGIIPDDDAQQLKQMGVGYLFSPGTPTHEIAEYISEWTEKNRPF